MMVPCGQCIGCRLSRSQEWAVRCVHEASLYEDNCFITLTYSDEHLPADYSVDVRAFQLFMKRLRFKHGANIRFFHCGEYGEKTFRPHYHALLFNFDFANKVPHEKTNNGDILYVSKDLQELWPYGHSTIGTVTKQSAAYIARYSLKKIGGKAAEKHYERIHPLTGEIVNVKPEYLTMSRRPGIGYGWYQKYKSDVFPSDFVIHDGKKTKVPRFYDEKLAEDTLATLKRKRKRAARKHKANTTPERLKVRETIQNLRAKRLIKGIE